MIAMIIMNNVLNFMHNNIISADTQAIQHNDIGRTITASSVCQVSADLIRKSHSYIDETQKPKSS